MKKRWYCFFFVPLLKNRKNKKQLEPFCNGRKKKQYQRFFRWMGYGETKKNFFENGKFATEKI